MQAGILIRRLQEGDLIEMPHSRQLPIVGGSCHELRIVDDNIT